MTGSETHINRPKVNYLARKREKIRQIKQGQVSGTIDSKKARQIKLFKRKAIRKEKKKNAKESKMEIDKE